MDDDARGTPRQCWRRTARAATRAAALASLVCLPAACGDDAHVLVPEEIAMPAGGGPSSSPASPEQPEPPAAPADAGSPAQPFEPELPTDGIPALPDVTSGGAASRDVLATVVAEWLAADCGICHAEGEPESFAGGLELASLIESGLIVPGSSAASPLLARIQDGSMPPTGFLPRRRFFVGDLAVLASFIDQLPAEPPPACEPLPFVEPGAAYAALLADVLQQPAEARPFVRYLGLIDASNARRCGPALEQQRQALFKLVNSVSSSEVIRLPTAIDEARLLFRIDIRDYGWAHPIDLADDGSVDAADGWAAVLPSAQPYALELVGPEASALAAETGTPVPFLTVNAFVQAASSGDVYRALLGVRANRFDTELELGLDPQQSLFDGELRRAAFFRRDLGDVLINRLPLGEAGTRAYWWLDVDDVAHATSVYDEPMDLYRGRWTQTIWELPNGLHGYSMNLNDGTPVTQVPRGCVDACYRPQDLHAMACMACHTGGPLPVRDEVGDDVLEDGLQSGLSADELQVLGATYIAAADMDQLVSDDGARYLAALAELGIEPGAPDPVSRVYLDFGAPLDLERAAAELGVPATLLWDNLAALPPAFAPFATGPVSIERAAFGDAFADALCVLHGRNRPATCP